jgi:outer membrane protein TolC
LLALGPTLRWNLFDQGLIRNNVRLQDARLQELLEQYRQKVLEAAQEVDNAAISVVKTAEQEKLLEQTVASAERALEIAYISYREGYADFQRVLDAQRSLLNQENRLVSSRGEHISHLISLYKGLGGGWSIASLETLVPEQSREQMKRRTNWGELLDRPLPQPPSPFESPAQNRKHP